MATELAASVVLTANYLTPELIDAVSDRIRKDLDALCSKITYQDVTQDYWTNPFAVGDIVEAGKYKVLLRLEWVDAVLNPTEVDIRAATNELAAKIIKGVDVKGDIVVISHSAGIWKWIGEQVDNEGLPTEKRRGEEVKDGVTVRVWTNIDQQTGIETTRLDCLCAVVEL